MRVAVAVALIALAGCAAPFAPTGPVANADGTFTVKRQGDSYYAAPAQLVAAATQDAQAHCGKLGKQFKAIGTKDTASTAGSTPTGEVIYRCE